MTDADIILGRLRTVAGLGVHDGYVTDSDETENTISAPLPFVVYHSLVRIPTGASLDGKSGTRLQQFQVTFVGETREQAEWASVKSRGVLNERLLDFGGRTGFVKLGEDSLDATRDDTWTRPDGGPLFYGADRYSVAI